MISGSLYAVDTLFVQFHGSDMLNIYSGGELTDYLVRFAKHLSPNGPGSPVWPKYHTSTPSLLTLWDGSVPVNITSDTYRQDAMNVLTKVSLANPL